MGENFSDRLKAPVVAGFLTAAFSIGEGLKHQAMLKARLEVLRRSGFPDTVLADKDLRKGYTTRQVLLLLAAFALIDVRRTPSEAAAILSEHEEIFIVAMADALDDGFEIQKDGLVVVLRGGDLDPLRSAETTKSISLVTREQGAALRLSRDPHDRNATTIDISDALRRGLEWAREESADLHGLEKLFQTARGRITMG